MKSLESAPRDINPKIAALLDGPPSNDYGMRQIQLAVEKFFIDHPDDTLTNENHNQIMETWTDSHYSRDFRAFVSHPEFKTHSRYLGNIANIRLDDVEKFAETGILPE